MSRKLFVLVVLLGLFGAALAGGKDKPDCDGPPKPDDCKDDDDKKKCVVECKHEKECKKKFWLEVPVPGCSQKGRIEVDSFEVEFSEAALLAAGKGSSTSITVGSGGGGVSQTGGIGKVEAVAFDFKIKITKRLDHWSPWLFQQFSGGNPLSGVVSLGSTAPNTASPATPNTATASPDVKTNPGPSFSASFDFIHFQFFVVAIEETQKFSFNKQQCGVTETFTLSATAAFVHGDIITASSAFSFPHGATVPTKWCAGAASGAQCTAAQIASAGN